jgi:uncharacterized protein YeaO (DUF488 family)
MGSSAQSVSLKRVYETPDPGDGMRVLVERLWPRGLSKARAQVNLWLKEVAPSRELREWYGHDPVRLDEFSRRYQAELASEPANTALARLRELAAHQHITLVFAAHEAALSNAAVLCDLLRGDAPR